MLSVTLEIMQSKKRVFFLVLASLGAGVGTYAVAKMRSQGPYQIPSELHFDSPTFRMPILVGEDVANYVYWSVPGDKVFYGLQEFNPSSSSWEYQEFTYSTSFQVLDICARNGGRELYISGIQLVGSGYNDIVEKWVFPKTPGAYVGKMDSPPTPRGAARPAFSGSVYIQGGAYIPQSQRGGMPGLPLQPIPTRTVLYTGRDFQHFDAIEVDPEGRFLLMHSYGEGSLYSLDLSGSLQIQLEYDTNDDPHLASVRSVSARDVPSLGRLYYLPEKDKYGQYPAGGGGDVTCLIDENNDGFFDDLQVLNEYSIAIGATMLGDSADWSDPVNYGWDWRADIISDD